ncbi:hypothetical protein BDZ89DRAFT_1142390 [Hymenopellis radicata]|nr:hypothetical protein BDZ89DRAFT_1142390 [Hymenopellis radicata]
MQTTFKESAMRSTLPRLEDPLPLEDEDYETLTWNTPIANHELNQAHPDIHVHSSGAPVSDAANEIWDDLGHLMEAAANSTYSEPMMEMQESYSIPEDLSDHTKENSSGRGNECDADYSEEEEEEVFVEDVRSYKENFHVNLEEEMSATQITQRKKKNPPPKKARTQNTPTVANDEALYSLPSPPVDKASLKEEFLASLVTWPSDLRSTPTSRKHFLKTDPAVDHTAALYPKKVMCSGCKEYKMLDVRHQYYLTNWFAHRPRCPELFNKWLARRG